MDTVTVSPKFQVVIPRAVRERIKLLPGTQLTVVAFNGGVRLMPILPACSLRGIARGINPDIPVEPERSL